MRKDNAARECSCTDTSDTQFARWSGLRGARRNGRFIGDTEIVSSMVINDPGIGAGLEAGIRLTPFFHWIAMRKQRLDSNGAGCEQIQKGFHVSPFCPANKTDRIISAPFFVFR